MDIAPSEAFRAQIGRGAALVKGKSRGSLASMATVHFTSNLRRHVDCPRVESTGGTVKAVLDGAFASNPQLRHYILDDQGALRKHMRILIDGQAIIDRHHLSDIVTPTSQIWVMQALSGG
jgi:hypothetical protein